MAVATDTPPLPAPARFRAELVAWLETALLILLILVTILAILGAPVLHVLRFLFDTAVRSLSGAR